MADIEDIQWFLDQYIDPDQEKKNRRNKLIGLICGGAGLLALIGVAGVVLLGGSGDPGGETMAAAPPVTPVTPGPSASQTPPPSQTPTPASSPKPSPSAAPTPAPTLGPTPAPTEAGPAPTGRVGAEPGQTAVASPAPRSTQTPTPRATAPTAPTAVTAPIAPAVLTVPDLVGKPWQDDLLPRFNTTVRATADPKVAKGLVMSMSPTAGSRLSAGSAVTVVISNGPAPEIVAKVPDGVKRPRVSEIFKRFADRAMVKLP
jgi:hypothetical protein